MASGRWVFLRIWCGRAGNGLQKHTPGPTSSVRTAARAAPVRVSGARTTTRRVCCGGAAGLVAVVCPV